MLAGEVDDSYWGHCVEAEKGFYKVFAGFGIGDLVPFLVQKESQAHAHVHLSGTYESLLKCPGIEWLCASLRLLVPVQRPVRASGPSHAGAHSSLFIPLRVCFVNVPPRNRFPLTLDGKRGYTPLQN